MKLKYICKRLAVVSLLAMLCMGTLTGCQSDTKIVFTTGLSGDEIFKIGKAACTRPELMIHLTTFYNRYVAAYGEEMWNYDFGGVSLEDNVKDVVLSKMTQIKIMNLMAQERDISLTDEEKQRVAQAAEAYAGKLSETIKDKENITMKTIETVFREYAIANKVYSTITESADMEISDDEARTVTVQEIYLKNWKIKNNEKTAMNEEEQASVRQNAQRLLECIRAGEDFETVAAEESDDKQIVKNYGRDAVVRSFEEVLFSMDEGDVSDVIETEDGYYIVKCSSTMDYEATQANKLVLAEQRKKAAFSEAYEEIAANTHSQFRDKQWEKLTLDAEIHTTEADFFEIYEAYVKQ